MTKSKLGTKKYLKLRKQIQESLKEITYKHRLEDAEDANILKQEYRKFWNNLKQTGRIEDYSLTWTEDDIEGVSSEVFYRFEKAPEFVRLKMSVYPSGGTMLE